MKVILLAATAVHFPLWEETPFELQPLTGPTSSPDVLAEFAGRACYESWDRPNPDTATNAGYLSNIIKKQHFSVLEHASASFYITGVSRSLTHELIRHRHFSYSQLSQRFVNDEGSFVVPPALRELPYPDNELVLAEFERAMASAQESYDFFVRKLDEHGYKRKESREAARAVLPNATETRIVVTGNMRAWRDFIPKRYNPDADREIQEFTERILIELKKIAPNTFQDMELR